MTIYLTLTSRLYSSVIFPTAFGTFKFLYFAVITNSISLKSNSSLSLPFPPPYFSRLQTSSPNYLIKYFLNSFDLAMQTLNICSGIFPESPLGKQTYSHLITLCTRPDHKRVILASVLKEQSLGGRKR